MSLRGLFVTGTDTGVGKTRVAAAIVASLRAEGRRVGVLKPVATGGLPLEDCEALRAAVGGELPAERVTPIVFERPLAPVVAARLEGTLLDQARVERATRDCLDWWAERADVVVVEGVGGLLCPLAEGSTVADLAVALDYPLVVVSRRGLGTLNHTLLTLEAASLRALRIAGVVLNGSEPTVDPLAEATNPDELGRRLGGIVLLGEVPHGADPAACLGRVDWFGRSAMPRHDLLRSWIDLDGEGQPR